MRMVFGFNSRQFSGGLEIFGTDIPKYINVSNEEVADVDGLRIFPNPADEKSSFQQTILLVN